MASLHERRWDLSAGGGSALDNAGNPADLGLPVTSASISPTRYKSVIVARAYLPDLPPSGAAYSAGDTVKVAVEFSSNVTVTAAPPAGAATLPHERSGLPYIELITGLPGARAAYESGNNTDTLVFAYKVRPGDSMDRLSYNGSGALVLNGSLITVRGSEDPAVTSLPAPGSPGSLSYPHGPDTGPPARVVLQVTSPPHSTAAPYHSPGQAVYIDVQYSAPVTVNTAGGTPYIELVTGLPDARASYVRGSTSPILEFAYTMRPGDSTSRLSYNGPCALVLNGGTITDRYSAVPASTLLPKPGSPGSLSSQPDPVRLGPGPEVPGGIVLHVGILDEAGPGGVVSRAAMLAAADFNARQAVASEYGPWIRVTAYDAGGTPESAAAALRAAHGAAAGGSSNGGSGPAPPSVYVGPSSDRGLHAAMPYAAERGIVLVSAGSTAPSLAVAGDRVFRMLPSDALEAGALARLASRAGAGSVYAVLENASYGPAAPPPLGQFSHGFAAALADSAVPYLGGIVTLGGSGGGGQGEAAAAAAAAADLDAAVRAGGSPAAADVAVVYLGSPAGLAALAEAAAADYPSLRSATWLASGRSAGSALLAGDGAAAGFAAQAGLAAVRWSPPATDASRSIDSRMQMPPLPLPDGAPGDAARHRAYAAYDAVSLLGEAAVDAGSGDAHRIADALRGSAAGYEGALGDIVLDPAGDLWVPARYDVWTVEAQAGQGGAAAAGRWARQQGAAVDEARACSVSLARGSIDFGSVVPGQVTGAVRQAVINSGQLPLAGVELVATPWHAGSDGTCAVGDRPTLPAGLSEILPGPSPRGAFAPLALAGTTVAGGLDAGGEAPLWYRLNLTGYASLPAGEMTQCVTYVAAC